MREVQYVELCRRASRGLLVAAVMAGGLALCASRAAAVGLVSGLGGVRDYGENVLPANDDGSTAAIDITPVFGASGLNFFGTNYTTLYVNNNGNITFAGPLSTFTPFGISGGSIPIIAAYFADVDTRGAHVPADSNLVYYDLDTVNGVFTATWDLVGYFGAHVDKLNNFQIRLIDQGSGNFDIEFRYQSLQWTTGDASGGSGGLGGSVARAGYSAGDQTNFAELSASGDQAAMLDLVNQSNVGDPGRFVFAVNNGQVQICGDGALDGFEECDDDNADDGDGCSADCVVEACYTCSGEPSVCVPESDGADCSDGQFCNGVETCQAGVCESGTPPCALQCDEGSDSCQVDCPATPLSCRPAAKSVLVVKDNSDDAKDKLVWKWIKGQSTTQAEFGDPRSDATYALCIYEGASLADKVILAPDGGKWSTVGTSGYKYKDPNGTVGGLQKIVLKGSATDKAKVIVKGKGVALPDLAQPIVAPVTVQLVNGRNGVCWGVAYGESNLTINPNGSLKGKTP